MLRRKWWIVLLVVILVLGATASMFLRFAPRSWGFAPPMLCENYAAAEGSTWMYGRMPHHFSGRMMPFAMGGFLFYGLFRTLLLIGGIVMLVRLIRGPRWHHHPMHGHPHYHGHRGPYTGHPHDAEHCPECKAQEEEEQEASE